MSFYVSIHELNENHTNTRIYENLDDARRCFITFEWNHGRKLKKNIIVFNSCMRPSKSFISKVTSDLSFLENKL